MTHKLRMRCVSIKEILGDPIESAQAISEAIKEAELNNEIKEETTLADILGRRIHIKQTK